ncbi:hypothetical protein PG984_005642 [Apiospora sp. TS-2023a]
MSHNSLNTNSTKAIMADGRNKHGGLTQSIHNSDNDSAVGSAAGSHPAAQPHSSGHPRSSGNPLFSDHPRSSGNPIFSGRPQSSDNPYSSGPHSSGHPRSSGNPIFSGRPHSSDNPYSSGPPSSGHPRSSGNPRAGANSYSVGAPINGHTNNSQSYGPTNGSFQGPIQGSAPRYNQGRAYGFNNSSSGNQAYGVTGGPVNSSAYGAGHGTAYGSASGPNYSYSSSGTHSHVINNNGYANAPMSSSRAQDNNARPRNRKQRRGYPKTNGRARTGPIPTNNNHNQQPNGGVSHVLEPKHEEVGQVHTKPEQTKPEEAKVNFHDQFQSLTQKSAKLKQLGGAYYLEQDDRDLLWNSMDLNMSKFSGFETWVVPFPINFNFGKLALDDCNNSYEYLDSRYVRLVFRTHLDKDGNELVKEMLLSPANSSLDLNDLRLRHALMEGYWKLSRYLVRLMSGDMVNLAEHLKSELYEEIKQKKQERTN